MTSDASHIRKINLVEVLKEEAEEAGCPVPADLSEQQLDAWSEDQIRQYYALGPPLQDAASAALAHATDSGTTAKVAQAENGYMTTNIPHTASQPEAAAAVHQQPAQQQPSEDIICKNLQDLSLRFPPNITDTSLFRTWFPGLKLSGTDTPNPRAVIICFHNSGNAEDMFTNEGTGSRRAASPLLDMCRTQGWQLLAPQLPGRGLRSKEPHVTSLQELTQQLLPLIAPAICSAGGHYALVGHSMGCWAAYEMMLALRQAGFPEPAVACLSGMPWPHIPFNSRPWRQQKTLNEAEFKDECRGWDINEVIFSAGLWSMYHPMLRADFKLFDEYVPTVSEQQAAAAPLLCPLRLFWGTLDRRVTQHMVQEWSRYTSGPTTASSITGNHLFPLEASAKQLWLREVADKCRSVLEGGRTV